MHCDINYRCVLKFSFYFALHINIKSSPFKGKTGGKNLKWDEEFLKIVSCIYSVCRSPTVGFCCVSYYKSDAGDVIYSIMSSSWWFYEPASSAFSGVFSWLRFFFLADHFQHNCKIITKNMCCFNHNYMVNSAFPFYSNSSFLSSSIHHQLCSKLLYLIHQNLSDNKISKFLISHKTVGVFLAKGRVSPKTRLGLSFFWAAKWTLGLIFEECLTFFPE